MRVLKKNFQKCPQRFNPLPHRAGAGAGNRLLIAQAFQITSPLISTIINLLLYLSCGILGIRVALARRDEVKIDLTGGEGAGAVYIPDSSVLIDGRIADVMQTGFLTGTFIISQAVVNELKRLTESEDVP